MVIGNPLAQQALQIFFTQMQTSGQVSIPFLLVVGPAHIGKTTLLLQHIAPLVGSYKAQDFLYLQDFSEQLGKHHTIKLDMDSAKETTDTLRKEHDYTDTSVREVVDRFATAPSGQWKVVLFENIERMTINAANALLKLCEEPLPQRLLVATAHSIDAVLPTLFSRAFVIRMGRVDDQSMHTFLSTTCSVIPSDDQQALIKLADGRPGILETLIPTNTTNIKSTKKDQTQSLLHHRQVRQASGSSYVAKFLTLQTIAKEGQLGLFLDLLLCLVPSYELLRAKQQLQVNVHKESVLLQIALTSRHNHLKLKTVYS